MDQPAKARKSKLKAYILLGSLALVLMAGLFGTGVLVFVMGIIKSSEVYQVALDRARHHPQVKLSLGEPIEDSWLVMGQINVEGRGGSANLDIPISGPKTSATIHILANKSAGKWIFERLLIVTDSGKEIDLR